MKPSRKRSSIRALALILLLIPVLLLPGCGSKPREKVFVLGMDGITFDLLTPWIQEGKLPNFSKLIEEGSSAKLTSVIPTFSPPAWTTAVTGVNPGKHGIFGYVKDIDNSQAEPRLLYYTALDRTADPLWIILTECGRRSIVINIPCTAPPDSIDGIMISGFPQTSPTEYTYPPEFRLQIPDYRVDHMGTPMVAGGEAAFLNNLNEIMERRMQLILQLVEEERWDLFFAVLTITDRVQHYFWKYMDSRHPLWEPELARQWGQTILQTYQRMDSFLGQLREKLDQETTLVVMSDHGFGPVYQIVNSYNYLASAMPPGNFKVMAKDHLGVNFSLYVKEGTPYNQENLEAIVETKELLEKNLQQLRDPRNNHPVIRQLFERERLFMGPQIKRAPQIVGLESEGYLIWNWYPTEDGKTFASWENPSYRKLLTGFHRLNGVLIMAGAHIQKDKHGFEAQLMDIAPTVLYLLDQPIPENMDGQILKDPIDPEYVKAHSMDASWRRPDRSSSRAQSDSVGANNRYIEEQLRAIGYVQ